MQNQPQTKTETTVMMVTNASVEDLNAVILCLRAAEANNTLLRLTQSDRTITKHKTGRHRVWTNNTDNHHLSWVHHHNQNKQLRKSVISSELSKSVSFVLTWKQCFSGLKTSHILIRSAFTAACVVRSVSFTSLFRNISERDHDLV